MELVAYAYWLKDVAPLVGARVEMGLIVGWSVCGWSLPSWERGLKFHLHLCKNLSPVVAPLVGARVEIGNPPVLQIFTDVAPLVGARVEIKGFADERVSKSSLPSWERGLK